MATKSASIPETLTFKVKAKSGSQRSEIRELADIFRGKIVDVGQSEIMIETALWRQGDKTHQGEDEMVTSR